MGVSNVMYGIRLQWIEDSVARGICHGRQRTTPSPSIPSKRPKSSRSAEAQHNYWKSQRLIHAETLTFFINTSNDDIELYLQDTSNGRRKDSFQPDHASSQDKDEDQAWIWPCVARGDKLPSEKIRPPLSQRLITDRDDLDGYILQYYDQVVCSTTTILDNEGHNPLRFVIMPLAWASKNTLGAVLAIGATKLAHRDVRYTHKALSYRLQVMESLSKGLRNVGSDSGIVQNVEAILAAFILCWCDISDHCKSTWTKHIVGLSGILDACAEYSFWEPHALGLIRTSRQYLIYHLIMARATMTLHELIPNAESIISRHTDRLMGAPSSNDNTTRQTDYWCDEDALHLIEPCQGFSNAVLLLINKICNLSYHPLTGISDLPSIARKVQEIEHELQNLQQNPPNHASKSLFYDTTTTESTKIQSISATANANRLAALLFLDEICALRFPSADTGIAPQCRQNRADIIQKILSLVEEVCENDAITAALPIWPTFLVGCCAVTEEDRLRVLSTLETFQKERTFGSIPPACAVIESYWRQRDLGSDQNPRRYRSSFSLPLHAGHGGIQQHRRDSTGLNASRGSGYPWERAMCSLKGSVLSLT